MINKFKKLFLDISEKEYRAIDALSYSMLSSFAKEGPSSLIKKQKDASYFKFGRLTETLLFDRESFSNDFFMLLTDIPTASTLELANSVNKTYPELEIGNVGVVLDEARKLGLWSKIKDEATLIKRFNNDSFWNYVTSLQLQEKGKTIIDTKDYASAMAKVINIQNNKFTKDFFSEKHMKNVLVQLKGLTEIKGIPFKGMFDLIELDIENKIIKPFDFKTGKERAEDFERNFYAFKYYLQGGAYTEILKKIIKGTEFEDWTIDQFTFIYINSGQENAPIFKVMEKGWCKLAMEGWTNSFGYKSKGIYELIEEVMWHKANDEFQYSKETIENKGFSTIKLPE
jgi:hypothetical protein